MRTESPKPAGLTPLALARAKLAPRAATESALPAVAAAALFAFCALTFAAAAILAPPTVVTPMARPGAP